MRAYLAKPLALLAGGLLAAGGVGAIAHQAFSVTVSEGAAVSSLPGVPLRAADEAGPQFRGMTAEELVHSFYFTRAAYSGGGGYRRSGWATDWPDADWWIVNVLNRLTGIDVYPRENAVRLDDPALRRFPFIYALEVGSMSLRDSEVESLRNYLLAGGFMMIDDFWGTRQWANFEREIRRVLPEYEIVQIPMTHEIFSSFYQIEEIIQVPVVSSGIWGGPTWEQDGYVPYCLGIFDDEGRLMVMINWNTDIGDAWEHAENPRYPLKYSTYAYQIAANAIIHAMTH